MAVPNHNFRSVPTMRRLMCRSLEQCAPSPAALHLAEQVSTQRFVAPATLSRYAPALPIRILRRAMPTRAAAELPIARSGGHLDPLNTQTKCRGTVLW